LQTSKEPDKLTFAMSMLRKAADAMRDDVMHESSKWRRLLAMESDKGLEVLDADDNGEGSSS